MPPAFKRQLELKKALFISLSRPKRVYIFMTKSNITPTKRAQRDYSLGFKLQVYLSVYRSK